ncbi:acylneuraminate cytidylyltransferase family protein [Salegentibacter sp. F14]
MLIVIPARGGSKGVPGKNIKKLNGKPLIHYTIEAARELFSDEDIIVSTEDEKIKKTVEEIGLKVPFLRPPELAADTSGTQEVIIHALDFMQSLGKKYSTVLLLQPTSPFRTANHIKEAIEIYKQDPDQIDMVVSVKETKANPYYVLREENKQGYLEVSKRGQFTRRQDCPKVWELNGAIYVINAKSIKKSALSEIKKVRKYVMGEYPSHDIDTMLDWSIAETILSKKIIR